MRRPITYILLLAILCPWYQGQTTAGHKQCSLMRIFRCAKDPTKCPLWVINFCAAGNRKRSDIDDVAQETDLRAEGERRDMQEASGGETREGGRRGGDKRSDGFGGSREGDDMRSEFNDLRRQLSDEVELVDIGNHRRGHSPRSAQLDSAIDRLRSLLGTTDLDVDDRGKAEEKREERQEYSNIDKDSGCISNETQTRLKEILADIESRFDTQSATNSESKN